MKFNPYEPIIDKKCHICEKIIKYDNLGNGDCLFCGWYNSNFDGENEDTVIFPNLVSENKARKLINEGKKIKPDLNDFMGMLYFYGEVEFWYKEKNCCLFLVHNEKNKTETKIEFGWGPESTCYFSDKEDFIRNAKIENEYVKDVWEQVEAPKYI